MSPRVVCGETWEVKTGEELLFAARGNLIEGKRKGSDLQVRAFFCSSAQLDRREQLRPETSGVQRLEFLSSELKVAGLPRRQSIFTPGA
jgi:hypothetical protein